MTDPVGRLVALCVAVVPLAALVGAAAVTASVLVLQLLRSEATITESTQATLLFLGLVGGPLLAGVTAWVLLAPIGNPYRRGMLGTVSAFATFIVMVLAMPLNALLGRPGLLAFIAVSGLLIALLGRRVARLRRAPAA